MDKKESAIELEVIRGEQKIIIDFFEERYNFDTKVIKYEDFLELEHMVYRTIAKIQTLKGFTNKFWGTVIKYDLQSVYMKALSSIENKEE